MFGTGCPEILSEKVEKRQFEGHGTKKKKKKKEKERDIGVFEG